MSCDVGEVTERLENQNELWRRWSDWKIGEWALFILQSFSHFTYVTAHSDSPIFLSLHVRHNSVSNPSVASPTSQLILQPFFCLSYITGFSLTLPGEPPMWYTQYYSVTPLSMPSVNLHKYYSFTLMNNFEDNFTWGEAMSARRSLRVGCVSNIVSLVLVNSSMREELGGSGPRHSST